MDKEKRDAILNGYLLPGMTMDEVWGSIGRSNTISFSSGELSTDYRNSGTKEIIRIFFRNGVLYKTCTMHYNEIVIPSPRYGLGLSNIYTYVTEPRKCWENEIVPIDQLLLPPT
jgi:hypothetical protein